MQMACQISNLLIKQKMAVQKVKMRQHFLQINEWVSYSLKYSTARLDNLKKYKRDILCINKISLTAVYKIILFGGKSFIFLGKYK